MLTIQTTAVRYTLVPGVSTFSITFGYWNKSQIVALLTGEEGDLTVLTLGTDYTLTDPDGVSGTLTKVSDWGDATKLTIMRAVPVTQERDLINGQVLDAEEVEQAFDKVTAILQEHKEKLSRAILFSEDEEGSDISLPGRAKRQGSGYGSILGFDGTGDVAIVRDLKEFDDDVAAAIAAAAAASASETNAANSATKAGKWAEEAENVPVETGKYSAKHHATKAIASAAAAHSSEVNAASSESNAAASAITAGNAKNDAVAAKDAAVQAKTDAISAKNIAIQAKENSEAYALGTRGGVPVGSGDPTYQNNSKYYSEQAGNSANAAATSKTGADAARDKAEKWANENKDVPVESGKFSAKHFAEYSQDYANISKGHAENAEAFATGKRNGVDVEPGDPAYNNNSLYYLNEIHLVPAVITDAEIDTLFS